MLKYQFFNHRKTSSDSCAKLQAISHELRKTFDLSSWDEDVHDHLLQERMLNKVNRIRAQMESRGDLVRAGSGYISFVHTLGQPEGHPDPAINSLAPFEAVVSQLSPESFDQALQVLFNRVGYTGISSALSIWQQRNQEVEHNIMADSEYHEDWNVSSIGIVDSEQALLTYIDRRTN